MQRLLRLVVPTLAAMAIVVAGSAQVFAASSTRLDLDDAWCFDDTPGYVYCFDVKGQAQFVDTRPGSSVTIHERVVTVISKDGVVLGTSTDVTHDRFVFGADGSTTYQGTTATKSRFLDEKCHFQAVLKIVDFELQIDHVNSSCGS